MRPEPFFVAEPFPSGRRELLLISYEFPPAGSAGALRWQRLAGHAAEHGWRLDVVTASPADRDGTDWTRLDDLPAGTRVFGARATRLLIDRVEQSIWNAFRGIREALARPESDTSGGDGSRSSPQRESRRDSYSREEVGSLPWSFRSLVRAYYATLIILRQRKWAGRARRIGARLVEERSYDAVVTCGPPHQAHTAGAKLARRSSVPFVMDMRDPWSLVERLPEPVAHPVWYWWAGQMEARAVTAADLIVCNTEPSAEAMRALYPASADRCIAVMNGFDEEPLPSPRDDGCFRLAYAGSIYLDRDPRGLFRGAAAAIQALDLSPEELSIEFMGDVRSYEGLTLEQLAREEGVEEYVQVHPRGSRRAALEFLATGTMLVSLPQDSEMAIPSKIFEYMRYDAWLLAMARAESATGRLLSGTGADVVPPGDLAGIAATIRRHYSEYRESGRPEHPALVPGASRAAQAEKLFTALDNVLLHGGVPVDVR